jgi:hypothetical protein
MEKHNINDLINDLRAKRDALSLAHEQLKKDNDDWNKCIIVLSLSTGMIESAKLAMNWTTPLTTLTPILLSSIIASISALIKFKKFPEQMETLIKSTSLVTNALSKCRNYQGDPIEIDELIMIEYYDALEKVETSMYPDIRKKYLKLSHNNLVKILSYDKHFFDMLERVNTTDDAVSILSSNSLTNNSIYNWRRFNNNKLVSKKNVNDVEMEEMEEVIENVIEKVIEKDVEKEVEKEVLNNIEVVINKDTEKL